MSMNQKDAILKLVYENNGKIQTKLVVEQNLRKEALRELVIEGKLVRVCRGLYMLEDPQGYIFLRLSTVSSQAI